jgi:hypothetical protein
MRRRARHTPPSRTLGARTAAHHDPAPHNSRAHTRPATPSARATRAGRPARRGRAKNQRSRGERRRLAASRRDEEREREREMRQRQADASSIGNANYVTHPQHVSPSRNHAKTTPSSLLTQSPSNQQPCGARSRPATRPHDPNQTLCQPGNHTSAAMTTIIIGTSESFCQDPNAQAPTRRPNRASSGRPPLPHRRAQTFGPMPSTGRPAQRSSAHVRAIPNQSRRPGSNRRPPLYKSGALPAELRRRGPGMVAPGEPVERGLNKAR